jgi:outer membrane murein-binding lipoprotein Lpp
MSTVEELEAAVQRLSPDERAAFRAWYAEFDANEWDRQLEADVAAGRLDWLAAEALADRQAGRCTDR